MFVSISYSMKEDKIKVWSLGPTYLFCKKKCLVKPRLIFEYKEGCPKLIYGWLKAQGFSPDDALTSTKDLLTEIANVGKNL